MTVTKVDLNSRDIYLRTVRVWIGIILLDLPRMLFVILKCKALGQLSAWKLYRNRNERLRIPPGSLGVECLWDWGSDLYLTRKLPVFGRILFDLAMSERRIVFAEAPLKNPESGVEISWIIGHRGLDRLDSLLLTLNTIAAQAKCNLECIVIEQDVIPQIQKSLPAWVRYQFMRAETTSQPYSRSAVFNHGAKIANSNLLIFHDNDILLSSDYARECIELHESGYEFINLKRFVFYATRQSTMAVISKRSVIQKLEFHPIMQNLDAGCSVAADKSAFWEIGGFDERFVGWGGEDNEFWQRARTRRYFDEGYMPVLHLWHESQAEKLTGEYSSATKLFWELNCIPAQKRIETLQKVRAESEVYD